MRAWKPLGRAAAYGAVGYAWVVAAQQYIAYREIKYREQFDDVTLKYAPIKVFGRYMNPFTEYRHQTLFEFAFKRVAELFVFSIPGNVPDNPELIQKSLPTFVPDFVKSVPQNKLFLTWIGQSCFVAQLPGTTSGTNSGTNSSSGSNEDAPGLNNDSTSGIIDNNKSNQAGCVTILADPMFADYVVSPRVGPQRIVPAPCSPIDLPNPDVVLVSHDHQDHLDLEAIADKAFKDSWFVVPVGVKKWLPESAQSKCIEMKWWDKIMMPNVDPGLGYEIACTPTMHWSGRKLYDSNLSLWCSFVVLKDNKPVLFHGGDTGYSASLFSSIFKVYGPCSLAVLPCGAYIPRWHLRAQHMAPYEALEAMQDLHARNMVGVHWGTFVMSEEPFNEPPAMLMDLARSQVIEGVNVPKLGKTIEFDI